MASPIHRKGARNHFFGPGRSTSSPAGSVGRPSGLAEPGRPGLASLAAWPRLAGRWAALREGKEARAQEGEVRTGQEGAPPLLSPQVGYLVYIMVCDQLTGHI